MDKEYSWDDIIINPTSAGIEACIGKECYFSNNPTHCLNNANKKDNYYCDILEEIRIGRREPFIFKRQKHAASCIILKKEEPKSKYIPFESAKDLVESYQRSKEGLNRDTFEDNLAGYGIWVKDKTTKSLYQIMSITDNAVAMYGKKALYSDRALFIKSVVPVSFGDLLNDYEFLDSSPCGKPVHEDCMRGMPYDPIGEDQ